MSSSLAEELKCIVLYDVEIEARECATKMSVLNKKQYENLATFSWDNIIAEMTDKQTFLAEILLAVALPWKYLAATEYVVPVLGTVYGILIKERFCELSSVQKVVAVTLANEQTHLKVYDRLQPLGISLSHSGMLETMSAISGRFNTELINSIQEGKKFRIVGDNINFNIGVTNERKSTGKTGHMEHLFGNAAIVQNVSFNDCSDTTPQCNLEQLPAEQFIMHDNDWKLITWAFLFQGY
ncbi:hypothetical protein MAR_027580 [Mya arenaria]|uniref:Uncharacterized protein n=1 Tax=Mya arenaria TaxID=6604 RepID=A0ABY7ETU9_MYAAR|nr:hypothetical protein MAR_027580 [Mya arenaria]